MVETTTMTIMPANIIGMLPDFIFSSDIPVSSYHIFRKANLLYQMKPSAMLAITETTTAIQ
jgi:hypothetical protein